MAGSGLVEFASVIYKSARSANEYNYAADL